MPLARTALMKALSLRFGVLLTPAFWTTRISRETLLAAPGGSGGSDGVIDSVRVARVLSGTA